MIIGIGNDFRADDAVGLIVAESLKHNLSSAADIILLRDNPINILDLWTDRSRVFLIDALSSGNCEVGFIHRYRPRLEEIPAVLTNSSTHLLDIVQTIELGKALDNLPEDLWLYGIEASDFFLEKDMSQKLKEKLPGIIETLEEEISKAIFQ